MLFTDLTKLMEPYQITNKASVAAATRQLSPMSIDSDNQSLDVDMGSPDIEMNTQDSTATRKGGPMPIER
jgi:hypothetical protein